MFLFKAFSEPRSLPETPSPPPSPHEEEQKLGFWGDIGSVIASASSIVGTTSLGIKLAVHSLVKKDLTPEAFDCLIEVFVPSIIPSIQKYCDEIRRKEAQSGNDKITLEFVDSPDLEKRLVNIIKSGLHNLADILREPRSDQNSPAKPIRLTDILIYSLNCIKKANTEDIQDKLRRLEVDNKENRKNLNPKQLQEKLEKDRATVIKELFRPLFQQAFPGNVGSSLLLRLLESSIGKYYDLISGLIGDLESDQKLEAEIPEGLGQFMSLLPGLASHTIVPMTKGMAQSYLKSKADQVAKTAHEQFETLTAMPKDFYEDLYERRAKDEKIKDSFPSRFEGLKKEYESRCEDLEKEYEKNQGNIRFTFSVKQGELERTKATEQQLEKLNCEKSDELVKLKKDYLQKQKDLKEDYLKKQRELEALRKEEGPPGIAKGQILQQIALECQAIADCNDTLSNDPLINLKQAFWKDLQKIASGAVTKVLKNALVNLGKDAVQQEKAPKTLGDLILYSLELIEKQKRALEEEVVSKEEAKGLARRPSYALELFLPLFNKAFPRGEKDLAIGKLSDWAWKYLTIDPTFSHLVYDYFARMSNEYDPKSPRFQALDSGRSIFLQSLSGISADKSLMPVVRSFLQNKSLEIGKSIGETLTGDSSDAKGLWAMEIVSLSKGDNPARQAFWQFIQHVGFGALKQILEDALKNIGQNVPQEPGKEAPKLATLFSHIFKILYTKYSSLQEQLQETRNQIQTLDKQIAEKQTYELTAKRKEAQEKYEKLVQELFEPLLRQAFPEGAKSLSALDFFGDKAKGAVWALLNKPDALIQLYEMYVVQLEKIHQEKVQKYSAQLEKIHQEKVQKPDAQVPPDQNLMTLLFTEVESKEGRESFGSLLQDILHSKLKDSSNEWAGNLVKQLGLEGIVPAQVREELAAFASLHPSFANSDLAVSHALLWKYLRDVSLGTLMDIVAKALSNLSVLNKGQPPTIVGIITSSINFFVEGHTKEKEAHLDNLRQAIESCDDQASREKATKEYAKAVKELFQPLLNRAFPKGIEDLNVEVFKGIFGEKSVKQIWDLINDSTYYVALYHAIIQLERDFGIETFGEAAALPEEIQALITHLPGRVIGTVSDSLSGRMQDLGGSKELATTYVISKIFKSVQKPIEEFHGLDLEIRTLGSKQDEGSKRAWNFLERVGRGILSRMLISLFLGEKSGSGAERLHNVSLTITSLFVQQIFIRSEVEQKGAASVTYQLDPRIAQVLEKVHEQERTIQDNARKRAQEQDLKALGVLQGSDEVAQEKIDQLMGGLVDNFQPLFKLLMSQFGAEPIIKHPIIESLLNLTLPAKAKDSERKVAVEEASQGGSVYERGVEFLAQKAVQQYRKLHSQSSLDIQSLRNELAVIYKRKAANGEMDYVSDSVVQIRKTIASNGAKWIFLAKDLMAEAFVTWLIPNPDRVPVMIRKQLEKMFSTAFGILAKALENPSPALKHLWETELCDVIEHFLLKSILKLSHLFQKFDKMAKDNPDQNVLLRFLDHHSLPDTNSHLQALNAGIAQASGWRSFWPRELHKISFSELIGEDRLGDPNTIARALEKYLKEGALTAEEEAFIPRPGKANHPKLQVLERVFSWTDSLPCTAEEVEKHRLDNDQKKRLFKLTREIQLTSEERRSCASPEEELKFKLYKKVLEVRDKLLFNHCLHVAVKPVHISEMDLARISAEAEAQEKDQDKIKALKAEKLQQLKEKRLEEQRRIGVYEPMAKALIKLIFPDNINSETLTAEEQAKYKTANDVLKCKLSKVVKARKVEAQRRLSSQDQEEQQELINSVIDRYLLEQDVKLSAGEAAICRTSDDIRKLKLEKLPFERQIHLKDQTDLMTHQYLLDKCVTLTPEEEALFKERFSNERINHKFAKLKEEILQKEKDAFQLQIEKFLPGTLGVICKQLFFEKESLNRMFETFLDKQLQRNPSEVEGERKVEQAAARAPKADAPTDWQDTLRQIGVALPTTIRQLILKIPFNGRTLQENFPAAVARQNVSELLQSWQLIDVMGLLLESTANTMRNTQAQAMQSEQEQHERISGKFKSWVEKVAETFAIRKFAVFGKWGISPERARSQRFIDRFIVYADATAKRIYNLVVAIFRVLIWPLQLMGTIIKDGFLYYQFRHIVKNNTHDIHKSLIARYVTGLVDTFVEVAQNLPAEQSATAERRVG